MVNEKYWAWSYVAGKYDMAVEVLCTSFAPNWERMKDAIFAFFGLRPEHFPDDDLYVRHLNICDRATKFGPLVIGESNFAVQSNILYVEAKDRLLKSWRMRSLPCQKR